MQCRVMHVTIVSALQVRLILLFITEMHLNQHLCIVFMSQNSCITATYVLVHLHVHLPYTYSACHSACHHTVHARHIILYCTAMSDALQ